MGVVQNVVPRKEHIYPLDVDENHLYGSSLRLCVPADGISPSGGVGLYTFLSGSPGLPPAYCPDHAGHGITLSARYDLERMK